PGEAQLREAVAQRRHQVRAEEVARRLAGDHGHERAGHRMMLRRESARNSASGAISGEVSAIERSSARACSSERPERYRVLYAALILAIVPAANPRRFRPSLLMPKGFAVLPAAVTYGGRSWNSTVAIAVIECVPIDTNWCTMV